MNQRLAIFPGSFDPLTQGHVTIIERGLRIFDRVIVAVALNLSKRPLFTANERMAMIREVFSDDQRVEIDSLTGLLAEYAAERGAAAILRGLRAPSDFEYELQMAQMNRHLQPQLETVFLTCEASVSYVSSSLVKEVASLGGNISELVPASVHPHLEKRLQERSEASR